MDQRTKIMDMRSEILERCSGILTSEVLVLGLRTQNWLYYITAESDDFPSIFPRIFESGHRLRSLADRCYTCSSAPICTNFFKGERQGRDIQVMARHSQN